VHTVLATTCQQAYLGVLLQLDHLDDRVDRWDEVRLSNLNHQFTIGTHTHASNIDLALSGLGTRERATKGEQKEEVVL
jgi:hypothetical protein